MVVQSNQIGYYARQGLMITNSSLPFVQLFPGVGIGSPVPRSWHTLVDAPLFIIVGVTGVGKSTTLERLSQSGLTYTLLPNRRELTDRLIISVMQTLDGQPVQLVADRKTRFDYTRRYREHFPGGMSHALAQIWVDLTQLSGFSLFDGLRGADEVAHAVDSLPLARFIVLDAPDVVRVRRLLGRNDRFDQVAGDPLAASSGEITTFASLGLEDTQQLFTQEEQEQLLDLVRRGEVSAADLRAKVQIVLEERRNYDPAAAINVLQAGAPNRTLVINTTRHSPKQVAAQIVAWMQQ